jgi:cytochrome c6
MILDHSMFSIHLFCFCSIICASLSFDIEIRRIIKKFSFISSAVVASNLMFFSNNPALAFDVVIGEKLFEMNCAGCHSGGGNILNGGKTLMKSSLIKNDLFEIDKIILLVTNGKNQMPAYSSFLSPKGNLMPAKLSNKEIQEVSSFVVQQAESDWPQSKLIKNCDEYPGC